MRARRVKRVWNIALSAIPDLIAFAQRKHIHLAAVDPEAPLAAGIVDGFCAAGLKIFGLTKAATQLESSKDFAKAFMQRHNIPQPKLLVQARVRRFFIHSRLVLPTLATA